MRKSFAILLCLLAFAISCALASAQTSSSLVLDAASLTPVNVDAVTGLALDPIVKDRSNRPCARIKLHINRMTPQEISEVEVRTIGGNILVMKQQMAIEGNGLIIELTSSPVTRFYLHHDRLGDSNPVSLALEGNREYKMEAWNETRLSIAVSFPTAGAEVYLDDAYRGYIGDNNMLTISEVTMGSHSLSLRSSEGEYTRNIYVSTAEILFFIDPNAQEYESVPEPEIPIFGAVSLSDNGTANSYIVSTAGTYSISAVKGNSLKSVGAVTSVEVLWESFGTDEVPEVGSLISSVSYDNGTIIFSTPNTCREGNAVIAAKDASGTILWSWHIWVTDQPQEQEYYGDAGVMMDRNLGATSASPGDVGALGLLYQWGRKDPFLGSSSISSKTEAKSTITWPSTVRSDSSTGTVDYVTSHPTTYVKAGSSSSFDWHYSHDNTLWQSVKTIYDPCPAGWRVPDGGGNGIWSKSGFDDTTYDIINQGTSVSICSSSSAWYPASGYRRNTDGALSNVGNYGGYWSVTPRSYYAYYLSFGYNGYVDPSNYYSRASGFGVRCVQE